MCLHRRRVAVRAQIRVPDTAKDAPNLDASFAVPGDGMRGRKAAQSHRERPKTSVRGCDIKG